MTLANLRSIIITLSSAARRVLSSIQSRFGKPFLKDARIASIISVACNHKIWRKALILCFHNCSASEKDKASPWFPCQFLDFLTRAKTGKLQIASGQFQLDDRPWKPHVKIGVENSLRWWKRKKKRSWDYLCFLHHRSRSKAMKLVTFFLFSGPFFFFTTETIEKLLCSVIHSRLGMGPTFLRVTYRSIRLHSKDSTTVLS